jgi:hypothetical protein
MSLCEKALHVLQAHPGEILTAPEIAAEAEGRPIGWAESRRWDRACLSLVDHDEAWPQNSPIGWRGYRLKAPLL